MKSILLILFVLFVGLSTAVFWFESGIATPGPLPAARLFVVPEGSDFWTIAGKLREEETVRNRFLAAYAILKTGKAKRIVAGSYRLPADTSASDLARILVSGETAPLDVQITFPEGFTVEEMAARLTKNGLPGEAFRGIALKPPLPLRARYPFLANLPPGASLEGYLFPDTYRFFLNASGEAIVLSLLDTFEKKAGPVLSAARPHDLTDAQTIVLASIVEGEVRTEEDRRKVSDLFLRRLAIGQPLQSDATLRYALGETKVKYSLEETRTVSPYNTYANKGLPPGPINNPGLAAIRAACNPLPNPYFYFLNDAETGETVFSVTFDEHIVNKGKHGL